jgi:sugar/nucleoside kinase (ribokinase family)
MDVMCVGLLVADVVAKPIDSMPERGQLKLIDTLGLHTGGCASNTAVGLAKLGIKTGLIGKVGNDGFGDFIIKKMKECNIDVRGIKRGKSASTSFTFVMVSSDAERSFFHYLGANAQLSMKDIDFSLIKKAKILHVAGHNLMSKFDGRPAADVLRKAQKSEITTCLDTAWDSTNMWLKKIAPCLPYVDYFLPSMEEARKIAQRDSPREVAEFFISKGVKTVGLKMGVRGCFIKTSDEEMEIPAFNVNPVDATGAGDAFVAGFLAGLVRKASLKECGLLGNAAGACCVLAMGTTAGIRSYPQTMKFIRDQGRKV